MFKLKIKRTSEECVEGNMKTKNVNIAELFSGMFAIVRTIKEMSGADEEEIIKNFKETIKEYKKHLNESEEK